MIKNIMIVLMLVIGLTGLGNAGVTETYSFDGDGSIAYPNSGYIHIKYNGGFSGGASSTYSSTYTDTYYTYASGHASVWQINPGTGWSGWAFTDYYEHNNTGGHHTDIYRMAMADSAYGGTSVGRSGHVSFSYPVSGNSAKFSQIGTDLSLISNVGGSMSACVRISTSPILLFNISGDTGCVHNVTLYSNLTGTYHTENYTSLSDSGDSYSFIVVNDEQYKLTFSDGHEYEFTVNGTNIIYDYDDCSHTKYKFAEKCGNLIPDSEGYYLEWNPSGWWNMETWFYEPTGILDISNSSTTKMSVYTNTFIGSTGWIIDPVVDGTIYTLENPNISWGLKVIVQNESDGALIDGAGVMVTQSCYCTGGYSTRNKRTVNGMVEYGDMSLQDACLHVTKAGYKCLDDNSTGYNVFLSGRSNFSSKTWIVKLANNSGNNSSEWYEVPNKVDIHFRDVNGNLTSKILDTDAYVDLYYQNNNTEEEAMTMRFESSSTHTYFMPERTYTIPHDTSGYERVTNGYFTPWEYSYRAVIYNSSIYGWNITIPLTVRNGTREEEQHYQNLTTNLWFMYASDGKVDYRDNMKVAIHAMSNNTTLMTTDIELWKDGVYIACKNLTATDFTGADFPYYYVWDPVFNYVTGSNYSVRMYGFDRTLLETDYVVCESDDTTRKNKLTIGVKNRAGGTLNNCYIYLEDWGSLPTGSTYYNAYEGIDNGDYRYKATKAGYSGGGWESVNLTDGDKIVWYVLSEDYTNTSAAAQKFTDDDIKGFFFPLMFFLLICIVLGGLKYVTQ